MDALLSISFVPFILACLFSELTPGPNMGYLALVSAQHGMKSGMAMVVGICLGLLTMGLMSSLGVGALINNSVTAYNSLRYAGTAYLFWLAFDSWRDAHKNVEEDHKQTDAQAKFFRRGLITNLLNPKAALLYITVLPAFVTDTDHAQMAMVMMAVIFVFIATTIHGSIVLFSSKLHSLFLNPKYRAISGNVFAALLFLIAFWFLWSTQIKNPA